jgi:hypothetical protein
MNTHIQQIQDLLTQQVTVWTDELLDEARPQVEQQVRAEVMSIIEAVVEERTTQRMAALRPTIEQQARTKILHALAANGEHVADPVIELPPPTRKPLTPAMVHDILTQALDPITVARGIKKSGKQWACVFCDRPFDTERAASMHSRKCDKRAEVLAKAQAPKPTKSKKTKNGVKKTAAKKTAAKKTAAKKRRTRNANRQCIKPGCENPSKGPRFRHLCAEHKNANIRHVRAWQRKVQEAHA